MRRREREDVALLPGPRRESKQSVRQLTWQLAGHRDNDLLWVWCVSISGIVAYLSFRFFNLPCVASAQIEPNLASFSG